MAVSFVQLGVKSLAEAKAKLKCAECDIELSYSDRKAVTCCGPTPCPLGIERRYTEMACFNTCKLHRRKLNVDDL